MYIKQIGRGLFISIIVALCVYFLHSFRFFENLEFKSLDLRFNIRGVQQSPNYIIVIGVDDDSLKKENLGRWPWGRDVHAQLVDYLYSAGAKVIVFDVLFSEPDPVNPEGDIKFADACKRSGSVISSMFMQVDKNKIRNIIQPIESIKNSCIRIGFVNHFPEVDGVVRKMAPRIVYGDTTHYSLAVQAASLYTGMPLEQIVNNVYLDRHAEMTINYTGGFKNYRYLPYYKVLKREIPDEFFKGKIILIGAVAAGLYDTHPTPFVQAFPGIEIHANSITSLIHNTFIKGPIKAYSIRTMILFALIAGLVIPLLSPWIATGLTAFFVIIYLITCSYIFSVYNLWLDFVAPSLVIIFCYITITVYQAMKTLTEKSHIKKTFGHYLSPQVMDQVLSDPTKLALGGEKKELTILFSDIRGFTPIAEALTPEETVSLLNEYLTEMTNIIFRYQGTVDKFIGDAIMAFWGAPLAQEKHAEYAVRCGMEMLERLEELKIKWEKEGTRVFDIGIGINTGDAIVGNMGSKERMDYTVMGDAVNLASRIEGLNKQYKTNIILGQHTYHAIKDIAQVRDLGTTNVKGKEENVRLYELIKIKSISTP
ncbi:CHASE2 domain-containing protein [bacterium]